MKQSMHILTEQLFDYAGLFPPAKLPLENALANYMNYQNHAYQKKLGKFILPAAQSKAAVSFLNAIPAKNEDRNPSHQNGQIPFSILLSQAKEESEIISCLHDDLANILLLSHETAQKCTISSFEVRLPPKCYSLVEEKLLILLNTFVEHLKFVSEPHHAFEFFCEMPFLEEKEMKTFLSILFKYNNSNSQKIFVKLRTGGVTPESIPAASDLSRILSNLAKFSIPFKVTAGLHVPVPNFNPHVNAKMHGFLNVFFAGMIPDNADIVANLDYKHLNVEDDNITLTFPSNPTNKVVFTNQMIHEFRKKYFKGIGTCDFIEPIEHLGENFL